MITKKYIKELQKRYVGKRVVLDEEYNGMDFPEKMVGTITEVSTLGELKFEADTGGYVYLLPDDKFHEIYNWEIDI